MRSIRFPVTVAILTIAASTVAAQSPSRGLTLDDVLSLQNLSGLVLAPDSGSLALIIDRPQSAKERYMRGYARSDVWLAPLDGGVRRNLTNGAADQSGWWSPVWSPDGARLALLSNQGGDNVRLHLWDKSTGKTKRVAERGVDMYTTFVGPDAQSRGPIVWLDRNTVLVAELPAGKAPDWFDEVLRTSRLAPPQWAKSERGEAAVSILESGSGPHHPPLMIDLRAYDVTRGTSRLLGTIPYFDQGGGGGSRTVQLSPDGKTLAILATTDHVTMDQTHRLGRNRNSVRRLGLVPVSGGTVTWVDSAFFTGLGPWSPDGSRLAVFGKADEWDNLPGEDLYLVSATGGLTRATPGDWRVTASVWTGDGVPVAYVQPPRQSQPGKPASSKKRAAGWLRLDPRSSGVPIAAEIGTAPSSLTPTTNPNLYLAVADSALWSIDVATGRAAKLSGAIPKVIAIVGLPAGAKATATGEVLVQAEDHAISSFYRIPVGGGASVNVPSPSGTAQADFHLPTRRAVVFRDVSRSGTFVTLGSTDGRQPPAPLLAINEQLAAIPDPKRIMFDYRGIEGDSLKGLVVLPPDYQPGKRYPTVVWVYAGSIIRDSMAGLTKKNNAHTLNLLPLVTHGYALLLPSIPLQPEGEASDPYIELPKGVMTAVDRLIEMGIADPKRLGVIGQSYGGYSTYSLVTYTNRFQAAVSLAGVSDLVSLYGQFDVRDEYLEAPHENLFYEMLSEGGQTRMGAPPWDNLWRYLRNSPIYFVDRVQTPLMIIGADQDYVTMTQGEQFFTALHRQGKIARFVRYWGDGHVIESRGNVQHMWGQIFEWFDRYLIEGQRD